MLLSRYGDAIYFLKREGGKDDPWIQIMRTRLKHPASFDVDVLDHQTEPIFRMVDSLVSLFSFDLILEHRIFENCPCPGFLCREKTGYEHLQLPHDAFFMITASKKVYRLVCGGEDTKKETGVEYIIDAKWDFDHYYKI
jgi:hypothetical protein